jgi:hypothetical protein
VVLCSFVWFCQTNIQISSNTQQTIKMKSTLLIIGVLTGLLGLFGCNGQKNSANKTNQPTFQQQLETFKELGFTLNQDISTSDINRWEGGYKEFEDNPFSLMYQTLGQTIEREPWTPITNRCWDFDLEAIEDNGAYVDIMQNISRITNGDLAFENLKDYVNIEEKKAWVSFTCKGENYKWELKVDDDWADEKLFKKIQELAEKYQTKKRFTYFNTGGQDFVLGYHSKEELELIRQKTGLEIDWLK